MPNPVRPFRFSAKALKQIEALQESWGLNQSQTIHLVIKMVDALVALQKKNKGEEISFVLHGTKQKLNLSCFLEEEEHFEALNGPKTIRMSAEDMRRLENIASYFHLEDTTHAVRLAVKIVGEIFDLEKTTEGRGSWVDFVVGNKAKPFSELMFNPGNTR